MSEETLEAIEHWFNWLSGQELDENLATLGLKCDGSKYIKMDRLQKWLLGEYSATDFETSTEPNEAAARVKREILRQSFIEQTCLERSGTTIANEEVASDQTHPLQKVLTDPLGESQEHNRQATSEDARQRLEQRGNVLGTNSMTTNEPNTQIPPEVTQFLQNATAQISFLTRQVEALMEAERQRETGARIAASSTRIEAQQRSALSTEDQPRRDQHVNFQETFTCQYLDTSSPREPEYTLRGRHTTGATQAAEVMDTTNTQDSREGESPSATGNHNNTRPDNAYRGRGVRSVNHGQRDVGQIVRKWRVQFTGEKSQSIELFLIRVEECRALAGLTEDEVLSSLSELLTGVAATWYRNGRSQWRTWREFCAAARRWYGTNRRYQQRLIAETNARTQGEKEPVRDYITCLQALLLEQTPRPSSSQQLDLLHRNMRPELQKMVKRNEFTEIETLLELATEAELTLESERTFRPPPLPEATMRPDMAYHPSVENITKRTPVSAIDTQVAAVDTQGLAAIISKLLDEKLRLLGNKVTPSNPTTQPSNPKRKGPWRNPNKADGNSGGKAADGQPNASGRPPDKEKTQPPSKDRQRQCYKCQQWGHVRKDCPQLSGNGQKGA